MTGISFSPSVCNKSSVFWSRPSLRVNYGEKNHMRTCYGHSDTAPFHVSMDSFYSHLVGLSVCVSPTFPKDVHLCAGDFVESLPTTPMWEKVVFEARKLRSGETKSLSQRPLGPHAGRNPLATLASTAQHLRFSWNDLLSLYFPLYIDSFHFHWKCMFYEPLTFITYPFYWNISAFCPFVHSISALGLWGFKKYNFYLAPGKGSSTLCLSLPAVTLGPLVLLKCHQEGTLLIQGKEFCSSSQWIIQCWVSSGRKELHAASTFIFLIILIMHYQEEALLLIHSL